MIFLDKRWFFRGKWAVASLVASVLVSGCSLFSGGPDDPTAGWSAERLYSEAKTEMDNGGWTNATKLFESLETRFPFGAYAQQGQMDLAYVYWKDDNPDLAIAACDKYIKQYPNATNVDYVFYLKGLVNFNDDLGLLAFVSQQDLTERDPKALHEAFDTFKELIRRYPDSKYAPDAILRMRYLVNALASHEVHVAAYYLRRGAYVAAAERAEGVVVNYPQAPAGEQALTIMEAAYTGLDLPELSDSARRVRLLNFPVHVDPAAPPKPWWHVW